MKSAIRWNRPRRAQARWSRSQAISSVEADPRASRVLRPGRAVAPARHRPNSGQRPCSSRAHPSQRANSLPAGSRSAHAATHGLVGLLWADLERRRAATSRSGRRMATQSASKTRRIARGSRRRRMSSGRREGTPLPTSRSFEIRGSHASGTVGFCEPSKGSVTFCPALTLLVSE